MLVSLAPTISHARRLVQLSRSGLSEKQFGKLPATATDSPTISEIRTERFLDSSISGGLAGGLLSAGMRGARTVLPATVTSSLIALTGQWIVNEVRIGRLRLLARRVGDMDETAGVISGNGAHRGAPGSSPSEPDTPPSVAGSLEHPTAPTTGNSLPGRIMQGMTRFLPVRKLSDDEYLATLEKKRADLDKRLSLIDEEELRLFEASQVADTSRNA